MAAKLYTLDDVAQHNTKDDCWIIIFGKVYNVTNYLDDHPGGGELLLKVTGKDSTNEFTDQGHSHDAWHILDKLYVGEFDKSTAKIEFTAAKLAVDPNRNKKDRTKNLIIKFFQFLIPFIILNLAINFYSSNSSSAPPA